MSQTKTFSICVTFLGLLPPVCTCFPLIFKQKTRREQPEFMPNAVYQERVCSVLSIKPSRNPNFVPRRVQSCGSYNSWYTKSAVSLPRNYTPRERTCRGFVHFIQNSKGLASVTIPHHSSIFEFFSATGLFILPCLQRCLLRFLRCAFFVLKQCLSKTWDKTWACCISQSQRTSHFF